MVRPDTVAVVDDDLDTRQVYCDTFTAEGYLVVEAATGPDALALLRATVPGMVVILDEMLMGLSGTAILQVVVDEPALQRHQFVVCTAAAPETAERLALRLQLGASLLDKPFDVAALLLLVAAAAAKLQ